MVGEEGKKSLHLAHDVPTASVALEDLPDPAPEGALERKDALAAMVSLGGFFQELRPQSRAELLFDLRQGGLSH